MNIIKTDGFSFYCEKKTCSFVTSGKLLKSIIATLQLTMSKYEQEDTPLIGNIFMEKLKSLEEASRRSDKVKFWSI